MEEFNFMRQKRYLQEVAVEDSEYPELRAINVHTLIKRDYKRIKREVKAIPFLNDKVSSEAVRHRVETILKKQGYVPLQRTPLAQFCNCDSKDFSWWVNCKDFNVGQYQQVAPLPEFNPNAPQNHEVPQVQQVLDLQPFNFVVPVEAELPELLAEEFDLASVLRRSWPQNELGLNDVVPLYVEPTIGEAPPTLANSQIEFHKIQNFQQLVQVFPHTQPIIDFYARSFFKSYKELRIVDYIQERKKWIDENEVVTWLEGLIEGSLYDLMEKNDKTWFIATRDSEILGLCIIANESNNQYYLDTGVVHPSFWGVLDSEGFTLAEKLARFMTSHLPRNAHLYGYVRKMNFRATTFYQKMGGKAAVWYGEVDGKSSEEYHKYVFTIP